MAERVHDIQEHSSKDDPAKEETSAIAPLVGGKEASDNNEDFVPESRGTRRGTGKSESVEQHQEGREELSLPPHLSGVHQLKWLP